jgi:hypothetical protein
VDAVNPANKTKLTEREQIIQQLMRSSNCSRAEAERRWGKAQQSGKSVRLNGQVITFK